MSALILRLAGPTQAWDSRRRLSQFDGQHHHYADTPLRHLPTWTGVVGLIGAALGRPRGSDLGTLADLDIIVRVDQQGAVRGDFRTSPRRTESGKIKPYGTVETVVDDAAYVVGVGAPDTVLDDIQAAIRRPVYPLALGKREYPITLPIILGRSPLEVVDAVATWPSIASEWAPPWEPIPFLDGLPEVWRVKDGRRGWPGVCTRIPCGHEGFAPR